MKAITITRDGVEHNYNVWQWTISFKQACAHDIENGESTFIVIDWSGGISFKDFNPDLTAIVGIVRCCFHGLKARTVYGDIIITSLTNKTVKWSNQFGSGSYIKYTYHFQGTGKLIMDRCD